MDILVMNAGSSSLKYQLIDMTTKAVTAKGLVERIGIEGSQLKHTPEGKDTVVIQKEMKNHSKAIKLVIYALLDEEHGVIKSLSEISAVGHRVVHGGEFFSGSVKIDNIVKGAIRACFDMAPLHNPANLIGIEACEEVMPEVPQVAVFDTAFHQTMPKHAFMYGLPYEYYEKHKIRKYGFHGTSHKYVAGRAAAMLDKPLDQLKLITVHLGNGSSIAAVKNGKSIDTSMGYTPLAGVIMGTRCGDIDPAVVPYLMQKEMLTVEQVNDVMNKNSGVLGISGVSSDFRDLVNASDEGDERASLALKMFAYTVKGYIAKYAGVMGGADAVVFTAGVGENSTTVRQMCIENLEFMGIKINLDKANVRGIEADISADDAGCKVLVIPTNEELMIAIETQKIVKG